MVLVRVTFEPFTVRQWNHILFQWFSLPRQKLSRCLTYIKYNCKFTKALASFLLDFYTLADLQHPSYRHDRRFYFYLCDCGDFMKTWLEVKFKSIVEHFAHDAFLLYSNVKHGFGKKLNKPNSSPHIPPQKKHQNLATFLRVSEFFFQRAVKDYVFFAALLAIVVKVAILKESAFIKLISVLVTLRVVSKPKFRYCRYPGKICSLDESRGVTAKFRCELPKDWKDEIRRGTSLSFVAHYFSFCFKSFGILTVNPILTGGLFGVTPR